MCEAEAMVCPLCGTRKARRNCPAVHSAICTICCGTKRLTEIQCPSSCIHLAAAREHPPAAVRRQQERDAAILLPAIRHLNERQQQCFILFSGVIAAHRPDGFDLVRLADADVAEAAGTLAATLETATRGVIYEHSAASPAAQRLARDIQAAFEEGRQHGIRETDAAPALRAIEEAARRAHTTIGSDTGYLDLTRRMMRTAGAHPGEPEADVQAPPSLILP